MSKTSESKKSEVEIPPSVLAAEQGKLKLQKDGNISSHAEGVSGTFVGYLEITEGNRIPATLYLRDGKVMMLNTPYDNEESKGRPYPFVIYDLQILFQQVLREGQIR